MSVVDIYAYYFASTFQNKLYYLSTQYTTYQDTRFWNILVDVVCVGGFFATQNIVHNSVPSTPPELVVPYLDSLESQLSNDTRISSGGVDHPKLWFGFTKIENGTCDNFLVFGPKLRHRDMSIVLRRHFKIKLYYLSTQY